MATALQCPACGFKHRLDAVVESPVFPCSQCSRQLKLPAQYRNGASPGSAPRSSIGRGSADARAAADSGATRSRTASAPARRTNPRAVGDGTVRLPLRILAWVVAFVLGGLLAVQVARWTGIAGGDTFFDLMLGGDFVTYLRLALLVPVWALFAAVLATVFIEAPGWWNRRHLAGAVAPAPGSARPKPQPPAASGAAPGRTPSRPKPATRAAANQARDRLDPVPPSRRVVPRVPQTAAESSETGADADQRPRRIPRRDAGS